MVSGITKNNWFIHAMDAIYEDDEDKFQEAFEVCAEGCDNEEEILDILERQKKERAEKNENHRTD